MIQYRSQLVDLLRKLKLPLIAAEVGTAEGLFSRDLLSAGLDKLYSVDAWQQLNQTGDGGESDEWHQANLESAIKLLKPFMEKSIILRGLSHEIAEWVNDNTLGLCYVDCDHSEGGVTRDINAWYPKVVSGGIMAFHDYENENYGVKEAVQIFCDNNNIEIHLLTENKKEDAGAYFFKP